MIEEFPSRTAADLSIAEKLGMTAKALAIAAVENLRSFPGQAVAFATRDPIRQEELARNKYIKMRARLGSVLIDHGMYESALELGSSKLDN